MNHILAILTTFVIFLVLYIVYNRPLLDEIKRPYKNLLKKREVKMPVYRKRN